MASVITAQHHYGWGRHFQYIPDVNVSKAIELNYVTQSFGMPNLPRVVLQAKHVDRGHGLDIWSHVLHRIDGEALRNV